MDRSPTMSRPTAQDALTEEELDRLLAQPNPRCPTGQRNLALLLVMGDGGLRVGEATALTTEDMVIEGGQITHVRIRNGKGGKTAQQPLTLRAAAELETWLQERAELGVPQGAIFCTISRGRSCGHFAEGGEELQPGRAVSTVYVRQLVKRLGRAAGIERSISPHTLRHTAITRYLRTTGNLELSRQFARHSHIQTTAHIYSHLVRTDVDSVVRLLPGNGESVGGGEAAELQERVADLEAQIAMLRRAVSMEGRQPTMAG
jgi:integrase/recombinase XerD